MKASKDEILFTFAVIIIVATTFSTKIVSWSGVKGEAIIVSSMPVWAAFLFVVSIGFLIGLGIKHIH